MREMKDSGIECIGNIPKEWEIGRIKNVISVLTDYTANGSFADLAKNVTYLDYEGYARLVRLTDLRTDLNNEDGVFVSKESFEYLSKSSLYGNEILVANVGAYAGLFCLMPKGKGICTLGPNMFLLRTNKKMLPQYLYYLGQSKSVEEQLKQKSTATAQPKLNKNDVKNVYVCIPSLKDQTKICNFIEKKCIEIGALSADVQAEIETLEAYKQSVIAEAVTKGLDKNVAMKDSGIEWIGQIPSTWEVLNIKRIYDHKNYYPIGDGDHGLIKPADYLEEGIPYIRVQNLGFCTELKLDNVVYISPEKNKRIASSTLKPKDVLFAKTGATIGKTGIIPDDMKMANTTSHVGKITVAPQFNPRYVYYVLSSYIGYKQFWDIASLKSTRPELSLEEIKRMFITIPKSRDVQDKIVKYLDEKCVEIDCCVSQKQEQLTILTDYKKSLIYEYVTGKKDVPEI